MRSVTYDSFGDPAKVLHVAERPTPEPGPGQVRLKLRMSPIHNHDLSTIRGTYGVKPPLPAVPGTEALGIVDKLGEGVTNLVVGQRVTGGAGSAWADYYIGDAARVVPLPDSVSDETGCQLISMPLSALLLLEDLRVNPGDWIIQNAANGAVGKVLAMLAHAQGINVVNLVRRQEAVDQLEKLGIGNAVATESSDWLGQVKSVTGGAPIIRAVDSVAGEGADQIMSTLAEGGEMFSFGAMSNRPLIISTANLLFKTATVKGFWAYRRIQQTPPADLGRLIGELVRLASAGTLKLDIEAAFDIGRAAEAAAASDQPGRKGKIVLTA